MKPYTFGIVGTGWRAEFFIRIAHDCPERFRLVGAVVRDPQKHAALIGRYGLTTFSTVDEMLAADRPDFIVTSVPWSANLPLLKYLAEKKVPVLSETPIAPQLDDLRKVATLVKSGARIQVAEQYLFQPMHAARLVLIKEGALGTVCEADISFAHGYHGLSLLRHYLQTGLRLPKITARTFTTNITAGPGRNGPPKKKEIVTSDRIIAHLDFGDRLGVYDFTGDQYFSWIRSPRILARGEAGEINQTTVRLLRNFRTPVSFELQRRDTGHDGNLEGYSHQAIEGGGRVIYQSPFPGMRWSDDEIAVATSLLKMGEYVAGGPDCYSAADACHDRYLDILIEQAAKSGKAVEAKPQAWCS